MAEYRLTNAARDDLIRIHQYGTKMFGQTQADRYIDSFFEHFDLIAAQPDAFEAVDFIRPGYRRCVCGVDSIFYRLRNGIVEIMAIVGRQDIDRIFR